MKKLKLWFVAFLIYTIIDFFYQFTIGLKLDGWILQQAGISTIFNEQPAYISTILLFFILIAYANLVLVIEPSIEKKNISRAFYHGFLLGITAYATYSLPQLWLIKNYPPLLSPIHILSGGIFSFFTSGITTWLHFKFWSK